MTTYDELLIEADMNNLITKEKPLPISKGRIKGNRIAIKKDLTETEKKCVLAEELGHHHTTVGDILNQNTAKNRKQEHKARVWGYRKVFDLTDIVSAYKYGCANRYEIAEYLNVTESFLIDAIEHYKNQHGLYAKVDKYLIYFEPLGVLELNV